MTREPGWRGKLLVGGLFFAFPPLGWLLALGFRSLAANHLVEGQSPVLPGWRGNLGSALIRGAQASGVILAYFTPFLIAYWWVGAASLSQVIAHSQELLLFLGAIALLPPVFLPALSFAYPLWYPWLDYSAFEIAFLAALAAGAVFVLPAAFAQVALRGHYGAAFHLRSAGSFLVHNLRLYLEAWLLSLAVTAVAVLSGPLAPWLLLWSYLVILHAFTEALSRWNTDEVRARFQRSLLLGPGTGTSTRQRSEGPC